MAAVSASFVRAAAASAALQPACAQQKLSVARFNGLKAFPSFRQRAIVLRPAAIRRAIISASGAEESTLSKAADQSTLSKVQDIIIEQLACEREKVVPEAKFADLGADSLDTVEIMMALEEEFQITLDEENAGKISTVQEAADLIQSFIKS
ncbi:acyl carrier protein [Marchantia polymorpha subsp. ruderalis]|nr:hypothetical protein MARPO_0009s0168 [Marchantia polymorpha]PTQ47083.1 hypothetical protein MARPO_0009s0168 [Marchantia polymorpha]BBN17476.1 hypothetical protein Mp_7g14830 [Marchantia polymorpha subsp. ruderalis]BBN17477.1 hypothetical protein Mp_7g14830 [Marchantia polymorpha subsp. ruderalis]|eukprot:PTQ47082.1 hypothetical protein MARPO_0009s0168 [Marchantia polymorpha]